MIELLIKIFIVIFSLTLAFFILLDEKRKHDWFDQGFPTYIAGGDSFQPTWGCRYCVRLLAKDSQGNWFHLTN